MSFKLSCIAIALSAVFAQASATSKAPDVTEPAAKATDQQLKEKALETEMLNWAQSAAKDGELSNNPLTRAMAQDVLMIFKAKQIAMESDEHLDIGSLGMLSEEDEATLYDKRAPMPLRLYHLSVACGFAMVEEHCTDPALASSFRTAEPNNAFIQFVATSIEIGPMYAPNDKSNSAEVIARLKRQLSVVTRYDDYSQAYKEPLLRTIKNRPLPPGWMTAMGWPAEAVAIVSAFPEEQIAAAAAPYMVHTSLLLSVQPFCRQDAELRKLCSDAALLALKQPSNSLSFVGFVDEKIDHPLATRGKAFDAAMDKLDLDAADFFKIDWMGLKAVLATATNKGDVAAIEPAFQWAEAQVAKVPQKSAEKLAEEAARHAKWEASRKAREAAEAAKNESTDTSEAGAAATEAAAEAMKAAEAAAAEAVKAAQERDDQ
jgi:hypothetical protein